MKLLNPLRLNIVLFEPEIASNAGNIARTCACLGARLHLVEPMGFRLSDKQLKRASMDYWEQLDLKRWSCTREFLDCHKEHSLVFLTGQSTINFYERELSAHEDIYLIFGRESRGIDPEILELYQHDCARIPMIGDSRSLNLSNAVALCAYEVARRRSFEGLH